MDDLPRVRRHNLPAPRTSFVGRERVLSKQETLLVVDNCEHLIEATARLVETLLDSCADLRILATSREALGVAGETNWTVPPLSVPDELHATTVKDPENCEAVRLFCAAGQVP